MGVNLYASVAEFKDRLSITDSERDFAIDRALGAASRHVDQISGTRFYLNPTPEVRYYTADLNYWEVLSDIHIQSLTEVATDANGDGTYETVWTVGTDYHLEPLNATVDGIPYSKVCKTWWTGRYSFPSQLNGVRLTGTFGYCALANVPAGVREATMVLAESRLNAGSASLQGVSSFRVGTELAVTFGGTRPTLEASVRGLLDPYMRRSYVF